MNKKYTSSDNKEYKTPQAINDFIRYYRKQVMRQNPFLQKEELVEKLKRLEEFLLKRAEDLQNK